VIGDNHVQFHPQVRQMNALTILVLLLITLGIGMVIGALVRRTRQTFSPKLIPTQDAANEQAVSLTNLLLFLGENSNMEAVFHRAVEWLVANGEAHLAIIYPYDPAGHALIGPVVAGRNLPDLTERYRMGVGIFGEVASNRRAAYIEHLHLESRIGPTPPDMEAAYVMPLVYGISLLGVLAVESTNPNGFSTERRLALDRYAAVVGMEALVARRLTESQQAIARFGRFQELSQGLVEQLDTHALIQSVVEAAREMLDTQMSVLLEVREDDARLYPIAWAGISEQTAALLESRFKEDLKGLVAWARKPARTADLRIDQRTARASHAVVAGMVSELVVPVLFLDKLYGTLAVETDVYRDFTDEEMNLLMALAAQAGIALRNAQLFETVQTTNRQLESALSDLKASQAEIERAHAAEIRAYEAELEAAHTIQASLLPQEAPSIPYLQLAARNIPARHVSGDFYQYLLMPDGKLGIAVGDVSGKGMPAALLMAVTTTALRDEIARTPSAAGVLNELNGRLLTRMKQTHMNSAMVMSIFDPATNVMDMANAGMVQPYFRNGHGWESIPVGGYPLGAAERANYIAKARTLQPGSVVIFISDGVVECQNTAGELFGFERLEKVLNQLEASATPDQMIEAILKAVYDYLGGQAEPQDDITVVALQLKSGARHAAPESTPSSS